MGSSRATSQARWRSDKLSNNTLVLTGANTNTGATTIRAGVLTLRDSGTLSNTASVVVNYGRLFLDNGYLSNVADRVSTTSLVTLRGGTIAITGAAAAVASQTFGSVTLAEGRNDFNSNPGRAGANVITISNLNRTAGSFQFGGCKSLSVNCSS